MLTSPCCELRTHNTFEKASTRSEKHFVYNECFPSSGCFRQEKKHGQGENTPGDGSDTTIVVGGDGKPVKLSGSLFFALPDGGAVLYQLEGEAEGPEAASSMELETPAKTALAFTVPVANWLRRTQRYGSANIVLVVAVEVVSIVGVCGKDTINNDDHQPRAQYKPYASFLRFTMKADLEEGTPSSTTLSGAKTIEVMKRSIPHVESKTYNSVSHD